MFGLPWYANLLAAGVLGLGLWRYITQRLKQAEADRARADTLESALGGEEQARLAENNEAARIKKVDDDKLQDPLNWR